jgi:hypothetical protein
MVFHRCVISDVALNRDVAEIDDGILRTKKKKGYK